MLHAQDEEAELLAELARIKKEREEEAAKRVAEEAAVAASNLQEELIRGNPLIVGKFDGKASDFQVGFHMHHPAMWLLSKGMAQVMLVLLVPRRR